MASFSSRSTSSIKELRDAMGELRERLVELEVLCLKGGA
jgi:hypothetical protein